MPRPRKSAEPVVIPTTSLVASAVRYTGRAARIYQPNQDWQRECYRHYAICGEARFAAKFFGQALSRAVLKVGRRTSKGIKNVLNGSAVDYLAALFNGRDGQAQMLEALGTHLTIGGECFLVGRDVEGEEQWEIVSILEMHVAGTRWSIRYGDDRGQDVELTDDDVVIRIWSPNPGKRIEADSPFRSLLPILTEIEWLTRHIFAQTSSRLAGAGVLFLPQGMTFPPPPEQTSEEGATIVPANDADAFMMTLADAMLTPISDPSSPSAMIPITVTAPEDSIDKARLMHFWSELDSAALSMRQEAIHRFALGMDLPPEQVTGMTNSGKSGGDSGGVSHWGAWQIEESTIKFHIEPMLELICNALTIGYIRPLTENPDEVVVYDSSALRLRPDRSREAFELYDRGVIGIEVLLRENGFDPDADRIKPDEFKLWLLRKVATGSATPEMVAAALGAFEVNLPIIGPGNPADLNPAPGVPSLDDHPSRPRTPGEPDVPPLLAASEALVFRALERVGSRIRQEHPVPSEYVPAYELHTKVVCNGTAEKYLAGAWSCAPQVLDGIADVPTTVSALNAYCHVLMAEQVPHTRPRLAKWLERAK